MPEPDAHLERIAVARRQSREDEERLYAARLELQATRKRLARARQGRTHPADRAQLGAEAKAAAAREAAALAAIRETVRGAEAELRRLQDGEASAAHVGRAAESARQRAAKLRAEIEEERRRDPPDREGIEKLETELRRLERDLGNLEESKAAVEAGLGRMRSGEREQRAIRDRGRAELERLRRSIGDRHSELAELLRPEFDDSEALEEREAELEAEIGRLKQAAADSAAGLGRLIGAIYQRPHPRRALSSLDDSAPFLLLPLRLETIFVPGRVGSELWVRIYPDEIAVHTHEKILTDVEVAAGRTYWTELVVAAHLRDEGDRRRKDAWRHIVQQLSGPRASWVVRETRPGDWDALSANGENESLVAFVNSAAPDFFDNLLALGPGEAAAARLKQALAEEDDDALIRLVEEQEWGGLLNEAVGRTIVGFPDISLTKTDGWSRAPRTRLMPDRFVLLLWGRGAEEPREIVGELVPDLLMLGPDPLDSEAGFEKEGDKLAFGPSFAWMADFDEAVKKGMGFRVPLTGEEARQGFDRLCVLGVMASAGAEEGAAMIEELLDNHQYGPKGLSIVAQGTATNNTERDGSGYSDNDRYDERAYLTELDPPAFDPMDPEPRRSGTDGRQLADALGIAYGPLQSVRNSDRLDLAEVEAMNIALFPATLGYWLKTWMAPLVRADTARLARSFFTKYVTGRGPLPAIRLGDQPYGLLVTSDLRRWHYTEKSGELVRLLAFDEETPFLQGLRDLLIRLEAHWRSTAATLPFAGKPGTDPSDVLINILGLQPTSAEFYQRIGYSDEFLRTLDSFKNKGRYANELKSLESSMPPSARLYLQGLGFAPDIKDVGRMKSLHVLWQHYVTLLDAPNLVEARPPSETDRLAFNYIERLHSAADFDKIVKEQLGGPKQTSLLYLMLRNALLLQMHDGAYDWLAGRAELEPALAGALARTTLPGVSAAQPTLSKIEIISARVGAIDPDHVLASASVADFIWGGHEDSDAEARFVAEQKRALALLADATTASLERALVEHLDCCNYRLDAWQTGLFAQRLEAQRRSGSSDRQTGLHLGAYGWLEKVAPSPKRFLEPADLPESLRGSASGPILEEDDVAPTPRSKPGAKQGGFTHAPSINHASAAALLRNAYLSHADPEKAELFSVNLSSERIRRAEFVLEGIRNGQPVEALLGYQFERGLHDRTSASAARGDVPVIELNRFILPYRKAFPFEAREVVQAGNEEPGHTAPAYSVVNGLRLAEADLGTGGGFGLSTILAAADWPDSNQGSAIIAEQDSLRDTLDAVKDLLMAENAYQLVLGNFDRVAAVSLAQKEARVPPSLQVVETPRGSEFSFTNRVTLHFEDLDPELEASNPWSPIPLTPRARAETGLNRWLGEMLGSDPDRILCAAERKDGSDRAFLSAADLGLQPVDLVWLMATPPGSPGGGTELETRIAFAYRRAQGLDEGEMVRIAFNPADSAGDSTFAQIFPLARQLRSILTESRALNGRDFLPAAGGKATAFPVDKDNPDGHDLEELEARVESALGALESLAEGIGGGGAPNVELIFLNEPGAADDETFSGPLGAAFDKLGEARLEFTDRGRVSADLLVSDAETLALRLRRIADFGLSDAFPPEADFSAGPARTELLARAHRIWRRLRRAEPPEGMIDRASALVAAAADPGPVAERVGKLLEAGRLLFGETFSLLPAFRYHNGADIALADSARAQLLKFALDELPGATSDQIVEEWLQPLARVRPQLRRWETVSMLGGALADRTLDLAPVQLPHRDNDSWLAVRFPDKDPIDPERPFGISSDTLSIAAHGPGAFAVGTLQRGVLVDEWTEEVPTGQEITGISFRFNQPNAAPPQALLLAVTPRQTGSWDWDDLVGTLTDTLERAKRRAVEPAHLEKQGLVWNALAPALVSEFSTIAGADVSLDLMVMMNLTDVIKAQAVQDRS